MAFQTFNMYVKPFRIKVASGIFQQVMDTMLSRLEFVTAYLDDIFIKSGNKEEHSQHVLEVSKRINEYGFKLKDEKCIFFLTKIKYLGQIIDENGRKLNPTKREGY